MFQLKLESKKKKSYCLTVLATFLVAGTKYPISTTERRRGLLWLRVCRGFSAQCLTPRQEGWWGAWQTGRQHQERSQGRRLNPSRPPAQWPASATVQKGGCCFHLQGLPLTPVLLCLNELFKFPSKIHLSYVTPCHLILQQTILLADVNTMILGEFIWKEWQINHFTLNCYLSVLSFGIFPLLHILCSFPLSSWVVNWDCFLISWCLL